MKRVVMFSGGIGSWMAARRVRDAYGTRDLVLLFTDTMSKDPDLYRFLDDAAADIGVPVTRIADGRNIWQLFRDVRFLGNSRVAPCTKRLKRAVADRWLVENCDKATTACYVGIDWTEAHRFYGTATRKGLRAAKAEQGWWFDAPLCRPPLLDKRMMLEEAKRAGLQIPQMYVDGAAHNNCNGQCVKAGIGHWSWLYRVRPMVFLDAERHEQELRRELGDVSILSETRRGVDYNLTLRELRSRLECGKQVDMFDVGGCACFIDDDAA